MEGRISLSLAIAVAFFILSGSMTSALAETQWQKNHPRRTQVNKRLANQNKRIEKKVKNGQMTQAQAQQLHQQDKNIRQEERDMASQNGGHITKQEQRTLNQQENKNSQAIKSE
jgi:hypothetical protein